MRTKRIDMKRKRRVGQRMSMYYIWFMYVCMYVCMYVYVSEQVSKYVCVCMHVYVC